MGFELSVDGLKVIAYLVHSVNIPCVLSPVISKNPRGFFNKLYLVSLPPQFPNPACFLAFVIKAPEENEFQELLHVYWKS